MRRRSFIKGIVGSAAAWPLMARAQQARVPVVGLLAPGSAQSDAFRVVAFRQGLAEIGYVEGQNLSIEYRGADSQFDRLPTLAADLVRQNVDVIVAFSNACSLAAKAATSKIPIVFAAGSDPVQLGLVGSLSKPGGNATGVTFFTTSLEPKKFELLRKLVPTATVIGLLINPSGPNAEVSVRDIRDAANAVGQRIEILSASTDADFDKALAAAAQLGAKALLVGADPLFTNDLDQLVSVIARYAIPAIYSFREFPEAGGLMGYGISFAEVYNQAGMYTGRILKGAKPAELPVIRTTKFEFVINLKTAKALGLEVPPTLLALADEVIE